MFAIVDELTPQQEQTVDLLLSGRSMSEIAGEIGIHRSTIYRWQQLPGFISAMNLRKPEARDAAEARLLALQAAVIDTVEAAVIEGDTKTACTVLRGLGLLSGARLSVGPTDARDIEVNQRPRQKDRELLQGLLGG